MPYFLRAIYSNIQWEKKQFPSWLKEGDLPSSIIRDLRADDNALSLWEIFDDKSNLFLMKFINSILALFRIGFDLRKKVNKSLSFITF